jgi:uncharacterized membrane protein
MLRDGSGRQRLCAWISFPAVATAKSQRLSILQAYFLTCICCIVVFTAAAPQGKYQLVYQRNGNLVLYQVQGSTIIWSAMVTAGNPARAVLQVGGVQQVVQY